MVRLLLLLVLFILIARTFWRIVDNVVEAARGTPSSPRAPGLPHGVQMVRDPVCGTFVLPDQALAIVDGRSRVYFCSTACRDTYRARPSTRVKSQPAQPEARDGRGPEPIAGRS
jgi:YHS domain-containing protein